MVKDRFNLSIDKDLLKEAKAAYPHLSEHICENLRLDLRSDDENLKNLELQISKTRNEVNTLYAELNVLESKRNNIYRANSDSDEVKESVWWKYRIEHNQYKIHDDYEHMDPVIVKDAETTLGYSSEELLRIYDFFIRERYNFDCPINKADCWKNVEPEWLKYVGS